MSPQLEDREFLNPLTEEKIVISQPVDSEPRYIDLHRVEWDYLPPDAYGPEEASLDDLQLGLHFDDQGNLFLIFDWLNVDIAHGVCLKPNENSDISYEVGEEVELLADVLELAPTAFKYTISQQDYMET